MLLITTWNAFAGGLVIESAKEIGFSYLNAIWVITVKTFRANVNRIAACESYMLVC